MKHYVSTRLIDLFPFDKIYSLSPDFLGANPKMLLTKDLLKWYAHSDDGWELKVEEDLRYSQNSESLILDNGMEASHLSSLEWNDIKDFWEDEDFDPNFLGIAYAFGDEEFIFLNKIIMQGNWKNSVDLPMFADVVIRIPNDDFFYRITPPYPFIGQEQSEYIDDYIIQFAEDATVPDNGSDFFYKLSKKNQYVELIDKDGNKFYNYAPHLRDEGVENIPANKSTFVTIFSPERFFTDNQFSNFDKEIYENPYKDEIVSISEEINSLNKLSNFDKEIYENPYKDEIVSISEEINSLNKLSNFDKEIYENPYKDEIVSISEEINRTNQLKHQLLY